MRTLWVVLGLFVAGAVLGALAGGVALTVAIAITEGLSEAADPGWLAIGGVFGAPIGMVAGPPVALLLLRQVPLGRLFMGAALGTVIGGVAGWLFASTSDPFDQSDTAVLTAFAGFLVAAVLMRARTSRLRV